MAERNHGRARAPHLFNTPFQARSDKLSMKKSPPSDNPKAVWARAKRAKAGHGKRGRPSAHEPCPNCSGTTFRITGSGPTENRKRVCVTCCPAGERGRPRTRNL